MRPGRIVDLGVVHVPQGNTLFPKMSVAETLSLGSYARRVDLVGTILPTAGLIAMSAPTSGWIESLAVQEGEFVDQGTPLYTLDVDTATLLADQQKKSESHDAAMLDALHFTKQLGEETSIRPACMYGYRASYVMAIRGLCILALRPAAS